MSTIKGTATKGTATPPSHPYNFNETNSELQPVTVGIVSALGGVVTLAAVIFMSSYVRKRRRGRHSANIPSCSRTELVFSANVRVADATQNKDTNQKSRPLVAHVCHPANTESSKRRLHQLIGMLRRNEVDCTAMFLLEEETVSQGHRAVERYMEQSDYIIVCCDEEFKIAWDKRYKPIDPQRESYFNPFRLEATLIDNEIAHTTYGRLIVMLMFKATADCIPCILRAAPPLQYPRQSEDLLRRIHGIAQYQLPPRPSASGQGMRETTA